MLRYVGKTVRIVLMIVLSMFLGFLMVHAQTRSWSEPVNISNTPNDSWFPDLAVDWQGVVHVVWNETTYTEKGALESEQVFYTRRDGHEWATPNDIVAPQLFFPRNAIAVAPRGDLLMIHQRKLEGGQAMHFSSAPGEDAWSAVAWSAPRRVSAYYTAYMGDLAVDSRGVIHLLCDDTGDAERDICPQGCADTYYRQSADGGQTWTVPTNLSRSPAGSSRERLEIDSGDTIHVVWDEGWDRITGIGEPVYSVYRSSRDGGLSWTLPLTISYPTTGTAQLTAGADGQGGVLLVWRVVTLDELFYQWSTDYGESWSSSGIVPGVFSRPWDTPFDLYDMAADSAGHVHLLVTGRQSVEPGASLGMYHLVWDGGTWSRPQRVYYGPGFPEYPRIVISEGNRLHAAWFVRDSLRKLGTGTNYEIWYSEAYSAAPPVTPAPSPTPMPTPTPTPEATPTPSPTPYPTISPGSGGLPTGLYTESDDVFRLLVALSPVALLILVAMAVKLGWFRRSRR